MESRENRRRQRDELCRGSRLLPLHDPVQSPNGAADEHGAQPRRHLPHPRRHLRSAVLDAGHISMLINKRRGRGQTMVELALVMPLFLMVMVGTIALGLGVFYQQQLDNTVREAARYAAIHSATHLPVRDRGSPRPRGSQQAAVVPTVRYATEWLAVHVRARAQLRVSGSTDPRSGSPHAGPGTSRMDHETHFPRSITMVTRQRRRFPTPSSHARCRATQTVTEYPTRMSIHVRQSLSCRARQQRRRPPTMQAAMSRTIM